MGCVYHGYGCCHALCVRHCLTSRSLDEDTGDNSTLASITIVSVTVPDGATFTTDGARSG